MWDVARAVADFVRYACLEEAVEGRESTGGFRARDHVQGVGGQELSAPESTCGQGLARSLAMTRGPTAMAINLVTSSPRVDQAPDVRRQGSRATMPSTSVKACPR